MTALDERYELAADGAWYARSTGEPVMVKELTLGRIADWKELELFEREAAALRQLDHPSIPRLIEEVRTDEDTDLRYYLVYSHFTGVPLRQSHLSSEAEVVTVGRGILDTLGYLQSFTPPVLHRNITPDAILLRPDGTVALVDFGAVQLELRGTLGGSTMVGTSGYMAPEQLLGRAVPASDLYALGASLICAITGFEPIDLPIDRMRLVWRPHAAFGSPRLLDWLDRLVAPDPRDRFASATDAMRALGEDKGAWDTSILAARPAGSKVEFARSPRKLELTIPPSTGSVAKLFGRMSGAPGGGNLLLDVDRGYRLRGPDGLPRAGALTEVMGVETGFRGRRGSLWLATRTSMLEIGRGLSDAETAWLRDEVDAFLREVR